MSLLSIGCESCPHKDSQVRGDLKGGCDLLIIGEAPGIDEVRTGKPFTGPSGELLWRALKHAGITNQIISVTNAVSCRAPDGSTPPPNTAAGCRQRLLEEIKEEGPRVVLCLGNTAIRSVANDNTLKITNIANNARTYPATSAAVVIPVVHPAAVLRATSDYRSFLEGLRYTVAILEGGSSAVRNPGETRYRVLKTDEVIPILSRLSESGRTLGVDVETSGLNPRFDSILALGIAWDLNKVLIVEGKDILLTKDFMESPGVTFCWHNGKFDTAFFHSLGIKARVDEDTMLAHYCLEELQGTHGLKDLSTRLLGACDYESELKQYISSKSDSFSIIPRVVLYKYLAKDADYTLQLLPILYSSCSRGNLTPLYKDILLPASELLRRVENNGIYIDLESLSDLRKIMVQRKSETLTSLQEAIANVWTDSPEFKRAGSDPPTVNPNSPIQVSKLVYDYLGMKVPKGYRKDTRKETFDAMPKHPVIQSIRAYRTAAKMLSTYVEGWENEIENRDGRVHPTFLIHGTTTGRLSSRGPNSQNSPRDPLIRGIVQSPPGKLLLEVDLDQAELRVAANLSQDPGLVSIYQSGRKLHHEVAMEMYPGHKDLFLQSQDLWDEVIKTEYIRAKAVNFGILYGRTAASLAREFDISMSEGNRLITLWYERFPVCYKMIQNFRMAPVKGKTLISAMGRKRRFSLVKQEELFALQNEAANFPIQGPASDIVLISAYNTYDLIEAEGGLIINLIHDSMLIELANAEAAGRIVSLVGEEFRRVGAHYLGDTVPFESEGKIGMKWGSLKKMK